MSLYDSPEIQKVIDSSIQILLCENYSAEERTQAASLLGELAGIQAITPLCQALQDISPELRCSAAIALGKICNRTGDSTAACYLHEALNDPMPDVVCTAVIALGEMGDQNSINILHNLFNGKVSIILSLINAIEKIGDSRSLSFLAIHRKQMEKIDLDLTRAIKTIELKFEYGSDDLISILKKIKKDVETMTQSPKNQPIFHIKEVGNINSGDVTIHGDQVGIQHNYAPEVNTEANQQLTHLLTKLRTKYPTKTDAEIFSILINGFATMPQNNPQNWQRWQDIFSVIFAGGIEATKILVPVAGIPIEVLKRLYEIYDRNRKQLPGN